MMRDGTVAGGEPRRRRATDDLLDWQGERIEDLELLVRWLAMPYGDNSPAFATELPNGDPLESGAKLQALYGEIVGEKIPPRGVWFQCETCSMWQIRTEPVPIDPSVIPPHGDPVTGLPLPATR